MAVRLGNLATVHIPPRMAMCLADALIDAVETGATTTYENPKSSGSREVTKATVLDAGKYTSHNETQLYLTSKKTPPITHSNHERYT